MYFSGWYIWLIQEIAVKSESMYLSSFSCLHPVRACVRKYVQGHMYVLVDMHV